VSSEKPSVNTVQKFLHLLDDSDKDFDEELGARAPPTQAHGHISTHKHMGTQGRGDGHTDTPPPRKTPPKHTLGLTYTRTLLVGAELERLKQQVIFNIRDNADREREVNSLDLKIALLIKNRASLEDVVASTRQYRQRLERAPSADPANLKALDKDTRDKLEVRRL
jgi:hypothetical protein